MNEKSRLQIEAKRINSTQTLKTLNLLFFCTFLYLLLSNLRKIILLIAQLTSSDFSYFLSNIYFNLIVSSFVLIISVPILARIKAIKEVWFIFKSKINDEYDLSYRTVRVAVKKRGLNAIHHYI